MSKNLDLERKLHLEILNVTNYTLAVGEYDFLYIKCDLSIKPNYIMYYGEFKDYSKKKNAVMGFYIYDNKFDGKDGLYNSIEYGDEIKLNYYKEKLKGVKLAIAPDYTLTPSLHRCEIIHRMAKSRIVSVWLTKECGIITIPNLMFISEKDFDYMLDGFDDCVTIAISTKGMLQKYYTKELLKKAIKYTCDNLKHLKTLIVYSDSIYDEKILQIFDYAINMGIDVVIPENSLMKFNKKGASHGKIV